MLTVPFKAGDVLGQVKRINPARAAFDKALYTVALGKVYPYVQIEISSKGKDGETLNSVDLVLLAGMSIYTQITAFVEIAVRIAELHNAGFDWPRATATPEEINQAFLYSLDEPEVWEAVKNAIHALDFPNGKENAPVAMLTPAEQIAPNS